MMQQSQWMLPGGYIDATGLVHKQFELMPLLGKEEEFLAQAQSNHKSGTAALVTEILSRCVKRIGDVADINNQLTQQLLVSDRQYLLLMLRQLTFGERVQATLSCPWRDCNKRIDIDFKISDIPVTRCETVQPSYKMSLLIDDAALAASLGLQDTSKLDIEFRLPNGADQEFAAAFLSHNPALATTHLLHRCILRLGHIQDPELELISDLPASIRQKIEESMEAHAPSVELTMETDCPECGRNVVAPFELQDFFFGELHVNAETLYREVHYLAFHYHWSEDEIMRMPRLKRHQYINVLSNEIEQLNDTIQ